MTPPDETISTRNKVVLGAVISAYVGVVVILSLFGYFGYIGKTIIGPSLFLVALLTKRLVPFVKEWALFLSLTVLFDCLRGEAYYLTITLQRDIYMGYAIDWERAIFGDPIPTLALQRWLYDPPVVGTFENILTVFHSSHFLLFLLFALTVWYLRRDSFLRFKAGMLVVMYVGVVIYYLVPTIPPWMAVWYGVLPHVERIVDSVYNISIPVLRASFDSNPVAAMPSLHSAFPIYCTFVAFYHFRWRGLFFALYTLIVLFTIIYGAEHYIVDVAAGFLLALVAFLLAYYYHLFVPKRLIESLRQRFSPVVDAPDDESKDKLSSLWRGTVGKKLLLSVFIIIASDLIGQQVANEDLTLLPTRAFVERELVGKSSMAQYYSGRRAFADEDFPRAQRELNAAIPEMGSDGRVKLAIIYLGKAAYVNRDFDKAIWALKMVPLDYGDHTIGLTLAMSYLGKNQVLQSWRVMQRLTSVYAQNPMVLSWYVEIGYYAGEQNRDDIKRAIDRLGSAGDDPRVKQLQARLQTVLEADASTTRPALPSLKTSIPANDIQ